MYEIIGCLNEVSLRFVSLSLICNWPKLLGKLLDMQILLSLQRYLAKEREMN